jgi:hypothetical protein
MILLAPTNDHRIARSVHNIKNGYRNNSAETYHVSRASIRIPGEQGVVSGRLEDLKLQSSKGVHLTFAITPVTLA